MYERKQKRTKDSNASAGERLQIFNNLGKPYQKGEQRPEGVEGYLEEGVPASEVGTGVACPQDSMEAWVTGAAWVR